jgi:alanine dehydrogenase
MLIGVPKEIKNHEYRVGLTPAGVRELVGHGHKVLVQTQAGLAIGFTDEQYIQSGASIASSAEEVFARADMVVKVKEPQPVECRMLRPGQILFTYLHLAPDPEQTKLLTESGAIAIAYETVTDERGGLPCWLRCRKWPAAWPFRLVPMRWRKPRVAVACCWVACPA